MPRTKHASPRAVGAVQVPLRGRAYAVLVGPGLIASLGPRTRALLGPAPRKAALIHDHALPARLTRAAAASLRRSGFHPVVIPLRATEPRKSLHAAAAILTRLARAGLDRSDPVIALGGGITCDLAGFCAATFKRGTPLVLCPTTLLAMVDAAIGGKTAVNLRVGPVLAKNTVGAFHQPRLVLADTHALTSLPTREFRSGLAECLKHALIKPALRARTERLLPRALRRHQPALARLILENVRVKAAIVARDEREDSPGPGPGRMALNLGHTFAHAIETLPGLGLPGRSGSTPLTHGEAVALGLVAAAHASQALGLRPAHFADGVRRLVRRAGLPDRAAGLPSAAVLRRRMLLDKKARGGRIRLVLPDARGVRLVSDPAPALLRLAWDAIRAPAERPFKRRTRAAR